MLESDEQIEHLQQHHEYECGLYEQTLDNAESVGSEAQLWVNEMEVHIHEQAWEQIEHSQAECHSLNEEMMSWKNQAE